MRRRHFEQLRPLCPVCLSQRSEPLPLQLTSVLQELDDHILEGMLQCSHPQCLREFPIIDGIPIIVSDIRSLLSEQVAELTRRQDLSHVAESVIGDCCGPGSSFDTTRQQLSSYAWDHYGDCDPEETGSEPGPGGILRVLAAGVSLVEEPLQGPVLDMGCAVGRSSFSLASSSEQLVLGIDLNLGLLRVAQQALVHKRVRYPRRRLGLVYDRREFSVDFAHSDLVDFWACDACVLPFAAQQFGAITCLNALDCVHSPSGLLAAISGALRVDGAAILACPYDWSAVATPVENWLGGHSQRGVELGSSEAWLRRMLGGQHPSALQGLRMVQESNVDWMVRLHERSAVHYQSHLVLARRRAE